MSTSLFPPLSTTVTDAALPSIKLRPGRVPIRDPPLSTVIAVKYPGAEWSPQPKALSQLMMSPEAMPSRTVLLEWM